MLGSFTPGPSQYQASIVMDPMTCWHEDRLSRLDDHKSAYNTLASTANSNADLYSSSKLSPLALWLLIS